jgi:hypothetical protein
MYVCMYVCMYMYVCIYVYVCMYVCMYVCVYVYTYLLVHIVPICQGLLVVLLPLPQQTDLLLSIGQLVGHHYHLHEDRAAALLLMVGIYRRR